VSVEPEEEPVEVETWVRAAPEVVFSFFTDPDKYPRWQGQKAELDPRPGGRYRVDMDGTNVARGEYVEVDPPRRVVFTWGFEGSPGMPPGSSTVEVTLIPDGDGTIVRLRHTGLPDQDSRAQHEAGWQHYTQRLVVEAGR
jgi:uncharacterized protein YndB with AHSA1/START domain